MSWLMVSRVLLYKYQQMFSFFGKWSNSGAQTVNSEMNCLSSRKRASSGHWCHFWHDGRRKKGAKSHADKLSRPSYEPGTTWKCWRETKFARSRSVGTSFIFTDFQNICPSDHSVTSKLPAFRLVHCFVHTWSGHDDMVMRVISVPLQLTALLFCPQIIGISTNFKRVWSSPKFSQALPLIFWSPFWKEREKEGSPCASQSYAHSNFQ